MQTKEDAMSKEQLLRELADAFEKLIGTATEAAKRGVTRKGDTWGPREIVAHMAGWEVIATVRLPKIAAGMPPFEDTDETRQAVMDDAINATIVTMVGDQPLEAVCGILRQAYRSDIEVLRKLDETFFQPGEYVFERTKAAIEHCQEHMQDLVISHT
jgi:hypothetical protein